ncbi:MAG: nucleotidyltransferase family protein [Deltaproteobacteria bacterium]|nr:nucleotidyltransferase family protein [Deltaproteobacteria bacterium]
MTGNKGIAALILAAGYSSRMGALKPLLPLGQSTALEEGVRRFRRAGIADIRVVTGHRAGEIAPVLDRLGVRQVFNPEYDKGMFSSIRAGLGTFGPDTEAFFLLPVDIPLIRPGTIAALVQAHSRHQVDVIYPCFEGRRGHPPLISMSCVADLPPDQAGGLRAFLAQHDGPVLDLEVLDEFILNDFDTPEDYHRLQLISIKRKFQTPFCYCLDISRKSVIW